MFSCKYCEIFKNSFFNRTPSVAASKKTTSRLMARNLTLLKRDLAITQVVSYKICKIF